MRTGKSVAGGLLGVLIFALIFLGGCTTMRKTLDAIIEGREKGQGEVAALAAPAPPPGAAGGGQPWVY